MAIETVKERRTRLQAELDILNKIEKPTSKQTRKATSLIKQITALDAKIFKGRERKRQLEGTLPKIQKATAAKVVEAAGPARPAVKVTTSPPSTTAGTQKTSKAVLDHASEKARQAAAEEKRKAAAAEKAKLNRAAALKSEAGQPQTAAQKKAAKDASVDIVPKRPKAKSRDTLGMAAKEGKAAREKRETARRKKQAYTVDPSRYKINPMESPGGYADLSQQEKREGITTALKKAEKDTPGRFGTAAGKRAIKGFFSDVLGIDDISVEYDDPAKFGDQTDSYGKKKGGKVTAKRPTAKKYAMNRGGKSASVRKPTRA